MSNEGGLIVSDLHHSYGKVRALQGVSLHAAEGCLTSIVGANGMGKSTLLKSIAGLIRPKSGAIAYGGSTAVATLAAYRRVRDLGIVLVPEDRGILARMTVLDNLRVASSTARRGMLLSEDVTEDEIFELFPALGERRRQPAGNLSGGEQQMLAVARALVMRPSLLLLDEPSVGLAPVLVELIFTSLTSHRKNRSMTIVLVEQNTELALDVSDYVYVLELGRIVIEGLPADVRKRPELQDAYLGM